MGRQDAEYDDNSEDGQPQFMRVDHFDGELSAVSELARRIHALAASRDRSKISADICDYPPSVRAILDAGYTVNPDKFSLWVLELKLTSDE